MWEKHESPRYVARHYETNETLQSAKLWPITGPWPGRDTPALRNERDPPSAEWSAGPPPKPADLFEKGSRDRPWNLGFVFAEGVV